ncbi:hypothetical protein Hdeb2414_s0014g00433991 [Helianthus debilis subsp. tardiflorus]
MTCLAIKGSVSDVPHFGINKKKKKKLDYLHGKLTKSIPFLPKRYVIRLMFVICPRCNARGSNC